MINNRDITSPLNMYAEVIIFTENKLYISNTPSLHFQLESNISIVTLSASSIFHFIRFLGFSDSINFLSRRFQVEG